jgi:hypothetical protein
MENNIDKTVEKLLNYSFSEIGWEYSALTSVEKSLMTEEEFEELKKKYGPKQSQSHTTTK